MQTLFIDTQEGQLGKKDERLIFKNYSTGEERDIKILDIHDIVVLGRATITTPAIHLLMEKKVPVHYVGLDGKYKGSIIPALGKNINLRILQYKLDSGKKLELSKLFIAGKVKNQITMLFRWQKNYGIRLEEEIEQIKKIKKKLPSAQDIAELMGYEGAISKIYFEGFKKVLPPEFCFEERNRRPPRDVVNALLSFTYTIFLTQCITGAFLSGLDPYFGYLHSNVYGRPALALDLLEEIRPVADAFVLSLLRNEQLNNENFENKFGGVYLTDEGRRTFLRKIRDRLERQSSHILMKGNITFQKTVYLQFKVLVKYLIGDIERYIPLTYK
ncbi:CRISPR-associated endonuclease Cas1 [Caldicellulosiruptor acetigenus]|uniref:CRISPR-associated endonuclease Cas1 n=1 Tax=Caldicellulosiruptor acetigenus 6A TaxID=632516 RepID=G2PT66_9FIRM|nr:CRISPR-associated endonuclease Cas1 [Caldicellulosiruptor acetigenus]AEM74225.1 CRISPR-associated protein Cas1 [Caldicellulosiruptor acetigenus 6A]